MITKYELIVAKQVALKQNDFMTAIKLQIAIDAASTLIEFFKEKSNEQH